MKTTHINSNNTIFSVLLIAILTFFTSCDKNDAEIEDIANISQNEIKFDFNQFGKTHNDYLAYVWNIKDRDNAEARFNHGLTFVDPTFGSFNKGQKFEDIDVEFHLQRVDAILEGTYNAEREKLSKPMTNFLNKLAETTKKASDNEVTVAEFKNQIATIEKEIYNSERIQIDIKKGVSNDGAAMLAITSILKYSTEYWVTFDNNGDGDIGNTPLRKGKIKRALADAWGYVSAWTNNGDGSYSWSHESALVNADCVSDSVR